MQAPDLVEQRPHGCQPHGGGLNGSANRTVTLPHHGTSGTRSTQIHDFSAFGERIAKFIRSANVLTESERWKRVCEAVRLVDFASERGWLSRSTPKADREHLIFFSIARTYSQSSIADAFRAVLRFTRFCSSTSTLLEPVTISKVARFLGDVQDGASNRSKPHCGLAADGVIKGLARAAKLVNAPFPQTILSDFQIQAMSVAIDASRDPREFGMSLALVCSLEDIALGEFWNQARAGKPMPSANEFEAWTA
jgi:hypothetical protein